MTDSTTADAPTGGAGDPHATSGPIPPGAAREAPDVRRCGYSRCRRPLPDEGTGRKFAYCPDRTWPGPDGREVMCRELGRAENLLRAVHSDDTIPDTTLIELSEHVTATLGPVEEFLESLRLVGGRLDGAVTSALEARDEAERQLAEEHGSRLSAERRTEQAEAAAATARAEADQHRRDKNSAEEAATRARVLQHTAEHALTAATTAREVDREQARQAGERARDATNRANDLERHLADLGGQLRTTREELATARERITADTERAAKLAADTATRLQQVERDHAERLHEARQAEAARYTEEVSTLNQKIGRLEHQNAESTTERDQLRNTLAGWRHGLVQALDQRMPKTGEDPVRAHVRHLLRDPHPDSSAAEHP